MDLQTVGQEAEHDEQVVEHTLRDRNGKPYPENPPVVLLVGEYSKQYRQNEQKLREKAQAGVRKGVEWTAEQWMTSRIAAAVIGWKNITVGGKPAQYSLDGVMEWFLVAPWHAKDTERAIYEHASFFGNGSSG